MRTRRVEEHRRVEGCVVPDDDVVGDERAKRTVNVRPLRRRRDSDAMNADVPGLEVIESLCWADEGEVLVDHLAVAY